MTEAIDPTVKTHPEPGTLCSRITLRVHIDYGADPFEAPGEWLYDRILANALNNEDKISVDAEVISHLPWVKLSQIEYEVGTSVRRSTPEDEYHYRLHCEGCGKRPSMDDFWRFVLQRYHNIRLRA